MLLDIGVDWEMWTNDADERVAEAAQSLVDMMTATHHDANREQQHIIVRPILPLPEPLLLNGNRLHVVPPIPSPESSRAATPPAATPASRSNKLPSKQVSVKF